MLDEVDDQLIDPFVHFIQHRIVVRISKPCRNEVDQHRNLGIGFQQIFDFAIVDVRSHNLPHLDATILDRRARPEPTNRIIKEDHE